MALLDRHYLTLSSLRITVRFKKQQLQVFKDRKNISYTNYTVFEPYNSNDSLRRRTEAAAPS